MAEHEPQLNNLCIFRAKEESAYGNDAAPDAGLTALLVGSGAEAEVDGDSIKRNVPPAADAARKKLEDVRRAALGLPPNPRIKPTTPGADTAISKMNALTRAANNIPERRVISVIAQQCRYWSLRRC